MAVTTSMTWPHPSYSHGRDYSSYSYSCNGGHSFSMALDMPNTLPMIMASDMPNPLPMIMALDMPNTLPMTVALDTPKPLLITGYVHSLGFAHGFDYGLDPDHGRDPSSHFTVHLQVMQTPPGHFPSQAEVARKPAQKKDN